MTQERQKEAEMYKQIETDFNYGFGKPVHLTVFRRSFFLFVTIDKMFGDVAVIFSFTGNFSSFIA